MFRFEHITTKDGLSENRIYSILQDSRGFVWFGTNYGINCYNGYEISRFNRSGDPQELSKSRVNCLYEDLNGKIWIGTNTIGMYVYDPTLDQFIHYSHKPADSLSLSVNKILSFYQDKNGVIWIGTDGGGLNKYDAETGTFTAFRPVPEREDHKKNTVSSIIEDNEGTFWIGTYEGIYHFDRNQEKFIPFEKTLGIPDIYQQIFCMHQDTDGDIWIGTLKGLFKYVKKEKQLIRIISRGNSKNDDLKDDVIASIQESKIGRKRILWIATRKGLVRYDVDNNRFIRFTIDPETTESISNNFINTLYLNDAGILWIGTAWSGVNKTNTRGNPFQHVQLKSDDDELFYSASSFFMDKKGYLWVGACAGGLFMFDPKMKKAGQYQYSSEKGFFIDAGTPFTNFVDFIYEDSDGFIWIGAGGWGPLIFDREREKFIYIDFALPEGCVRPERVQGILEDNSGTIWVGTDRGLFVKKKDEGKYDPLNIIDNDLLQRESILTVFEDSKGDLYFGILQGGVYCLQKTDSKNKIFRFFVNENADTSELANATVWEFYEDMAGTLWAASSRGLLVLNREKQKFEILNNAPYILNDEIYEVFGDKKGNLWFSSLTKGLIRYQPDRQSFKVFNTQDGLPFDNIVYRYWYQSEDGRIFVGGWLGDGNGFFYFHPDSIIDNTNIPQIEITDFKVKNQAFSTDSSISAIKHIVLKYNQNFFSFQFAALDYTNPYKNQYAWYLKGFEDDWNYMGNRRFAKYTGMPPGNYIFRVKGSNNDGYWDEAGTSISITVLPPPWKTWWAYTMYGIFLIGLIYVWRKYDLKRQRLKQELEIEQIEAEKLKELDKTKSRFFANISHEFRTPLTLILGPLQKVFSNTSDEETKQYLNIMQRNARRLQTLINQLLNLSKLESGKMKLQVRKENIVALVRGYTQSFESLARQKKIDLVFQSDEDDIPLYVDKDKIEKILYNLLSNAFKFTGEEGRIVVSVGSSQSTGIERTESEKTTSGFRLPTSDPIGQWVEIKISDTGLGIPSDKLPHIFDRFYQVDDSYSKDGEGTGIGLALTKELVNLHYGTINVESHAGEGSVFTVFLPAGKQHLKQDEIAGKPDMPEKREKLHERVPEHEFPDNFPDGEEFPDTDEFDGKDDKPLVLIVDDNADLRTYMRECLTEDYYILEAMDGLEGFNKAVEKIPDLIVSDVMMPEMDGYELCRKLKTDERTSHIPVILLTARASSESRIEGLETGADDFITKPFDLQELLVRIKNLILQRNKLKERFRKEIEFSKLSGDSDVVSMDEQFIRKAKAIVEQNISEPDFTIEDFAGKMALSRVQLHRKLKALTGQSATQFIRTIRLNRAAELLLKKSATVSEIAYDVGFNTLPYFTKCFQEQFGVNPSEFAKNLNPRSI